MRLTHKYAEVIDGIDLSRREVGERLPLTCRDARMLIAEGWAEPVAAEEQRDPERSYTAHPDNRAVMRRIAETAGRFRPAVVVRKPEGFRLLSYRARSRTSRRTAGCAAHLTAW